MGFNICILNQKIEKLNQWDTHLEFECLTNDYIISLERGVFLVQVTYLTIVFLKKNTQISKGVRHLSLKRLVSPEANTPPEQSLIAMKTSNWNKTTTRLQKRASTDV